ncbi:hypothetical protein M5J20_09185 [Corynebacterium sp. TA-R-1]|uniref:Uncharacterized protein n=1 Tax=Corynebacterium stercoris TaxID=2943490 RepID=A0ABT1G2V6_9CORY|nr:hypothetical protein [Corynebacterium stercoris]MCP1388358.1 hypothetical protein [Corynebacterium stercoris]
MNPRFELPEFDYEPKVDITNIAQVLDMLDAIEERERREFKLHTFSGRGPRTEMVNIGEVLELIEDGVARRFDVNR